MSDDSTELLDTVHKIYKLWEMLAEDKLCSARWEAANGVA